jgi:hypothetical protein
MAARPPIREVAIMAPSRTASRTKKAVEPAPEAPPAEDVDLLEDDLGDEDYDLLDDVIEDDAEGWVPAERGEGIQGVVLKVGETRSDYSDEMAPTVTIEQKDGTKVRVIGYGAVLRREILDANPNPGDIFAVKYFGEKPIKNGKFAGKMYKHFGVAVRRKPSSD